MGVFEIVSAIILIIACVFIVVVILLKDTKTQMSQSISGNSSDSFYQRNAGRTKEAMLNKATIAAAVIFFVLAIAVNVINVYGKGGNSGDTSSVVSENSSTTSEDKPAESSDTSDNTSSDTGSAPEASSGADSE